MKVSILYAGLARPHAGWAAIDELAQLLAYYLDGQVLSPAVAPLSWVNALMRPHLVQYQPLQTDGGDVLIVVCRGPGDLGMLDAIKDCRRRFHRIIGFVTDSYFHAGYVRATALYDAITVTAHEDMAYPSSRFDIDVHQLHQGIDCLAWAPRTWMQREIDLIGFGRMPPRYQTCFAQRFHQPASPVLYLHSPLGNLSGPQVHAERGMLFKLLQRSRVSLAFHLHVEPQGQRPRSMMVTSRWLESLLSGCIVAGKRPVSRMADDMLSWPGATVELADVPEQAAAELEQLLASNADLDAQRRTNVHQTVSRHDWRYRILTLCGLAGIPIPSALEADLARLRDLAALHATPLAPA